jgi:hypothetical protein
VYNSLSKSLTPNSTRTLLKTLTSIPPRERPSPEPLETITEEEVRPLSPIDRHLPARDEDDDVEILEAEESFLDRGSVSPTPDGRARRELFRIKDLGNPSDKARWQRLIEAVILDYIRIGPEQILSGGDGQRQNLDHRRLRRLILDRHILFFPTGACNLDDRQMKFVLSIRILH